MSPMRLQIFVAVLTASIPLAEAQTLPAAQPQSQSQQIQTWFRQLADRDPEQRELARARLLALDRPGLEALREQASQARPLSPAQAASLREIVTHVFLATQPYDPAPGAGPFLGIQMGYGMLELSDEAPAEPKEQEVSAPDDPARRMRVAMEFAEERYIGVTVADRIPGFGAFAVLRDGDVILGIDEMPLLTLRHPEDLRASLANFRPGDVVHLKLFRSGRTLSVPVRLSAAPAWSGTRLESTGDMSRRIMAAELYWKQTWEPLLKPPVS